MIEFLSLTNNTAKLLHQAFHQDGQNEPLKQFTQYIVEQQEGLRKTIVACCDEQYVGYITIVWRSSNDRLLQQNTPELRDLNVVPSSRRSGIGTALLNEAESCVAEEYTAVGLYLNANDNLLIQFYRSRGYTKLSPQAVLHKPLLEYEGVPEFESRPVYWMRKQLR